MKYKQNGFYLIAFLLILPTLAKSQKLYEVPDTNLVKILRKNGCTTNGRLDSAKADSWNQLDISHSRVKSLEGMQYFRHLDYLDCSSNDIEIIDYLPLNLRSLNCYGNKIKKMKNLPESLKDLSCPNNQIIDINNLPVGLKLLVCGHNSISKIKKLPPTLWKLEINDNKLTSLPPLPPTLQYINFYNNPLDKSSLSDDYKYLNCSAPDQNCIPYNRIHWGILKNNFDTIPLFDTFTIVISTFRSWGGGTQTERIDYFRDGNYMVAKTSLNKTSKDQRDSMYGIKIHKRIRMDSLVHLLKSIKKGNMLFVIKDGGTFDTIDLTRKKNTDSHSTSSICADCNGYHVTFSYLYKNKNYYCLYDFNMSNPPLPSFRIKDELPVLKDIMDWLYFYQLIKLCLPSDHEVNEYYFSVDELKQVVDWSKRKD